MTLIQLMVGMSLCLFVTAVGLKLYVLVSHHYAKTMDRLDQSTRSELVAQVFRRAIAEAGFAAPSGFWPWQLKYIAVPGQSFNALDYAPVYAADSISGISLNDRVSGSSVLMVQGAYASELTASAIPATVNELETALDIGKKDYLILIDTDAAVLCYSDEGSHSGVADLANAPGVAFAAGSYIGQYYLHIFYLRDTKKTDVNGEPIYSLYLYNYNVSGGNTQELIRGISQFNIRYFSAFDQVWHELLPAGDDNIASWYKAVEGLAFDYTIDGTDYTVIISIKDHVL